MARFVEALVAAPGVVSIALLTTMTVATGVGAVAEASGDALVLAALASSVPSSDCLPEESFDFLPDPDAAGSVGSPFCAFAAAATAAAVVATVVTAPGSALPCGELACADCGFAGVFGSAAFGSELAVWLPVFEVCDEDVVPLPPFALAEEELALPWAEPDDVPDVLPDGCEPPPFWLVAPDELPLLAFSVGCAGAEVVLLAALELPLLSLLPEAPVDPVVAAVACCWAGDGLAGAGGGTLAGLGAVASSRAANGLVSIWPWADAAAASEDEEAAVEALGAILGTLGTVETPEATIIMIVPLATVRPAGLLKESLYISIR